MSSFLRTSISAAAKTVITDTNLLVPMSVKLQTLGTFVSKVPVIGSAGIFVSVLAAAAKTFETDDTYSSALQFFISFLVYMNFVIRAKIIILDIVNCALAKIAVDKFAVDEKITTATGSRTLTITEKYEVAVNTINEETRYQDIKDMYDFFNAIDLDEIQQALVSFTDAVLKNNGSNYSMIFSDQIQITLQKKLVYFSNKMIILSTKFNTFISRIQMKQSQSQKYKRFLREIYDSDEYKKIFQIEPNTEALFDDMTKLGNEIISKEIHLNKKPEGLIVKVETQGFVSAKIDTGICIC